MSIATAPDDALPVSGSHNHFLFRRLHSLTGLVFGGYLIVHLLVNATIAQLGTHYQVQVDKIHSLPVLWAIEWVAIYLPILFHTFYGIWIAIGGQPNVSNYGYKKNWFYLLQRISGIVILLFMIFHVFSLKVGWFGPNMVFDPHAASATVHRHLNQFWWVTWIVYPLGITASCYHLSNGIWTAAVTWGLTVSAAAQKRFGRVCAGLFVFTMACGFIALIAGATFDLAPKEAPTIIVDQPPVS